MKFNLKRSHVTISAEPDSYGMYRVIKGCMFLPVGYRLSFETLRDYFTPVDGEALNLIDPDRNERLCPPII